MPARRSGDTVSAGAGTGAARHLAAAAGLIALLFGLQYLLSEGPEPPRRDALRYANYALGLAHHGTFGLSPDGDLSPPAPGNANAPLYPALISAVVRVSPQLDQSLRCALKDPRRGAECPRDYGALLLVQYGLAAAALLLLWLACHQIFQAPALATAATVMAAFSGIYSTYAQRLLTEILVLPLFGVAQLCLLLAIKTQHKRWAAGTGGALGLLTLTRPEGLHLAVLLTLLLTALCVWHKAYRRMAQVLLAVGVLGITVAPWAMRNQIQFGSPALTAGGYGEQILAYRLSMNRMTPAEWGTAFVYWLPDFGDKLAQNLLPRDSYRRLISAEPDSFIATAQELVLQPVQQRVAQGEVLRHLIRHELLGDPLAHAWVSLALFWRGIWVAKYWGLLGFLGYCVMIARLAPALRPGVFWFSLPAWLLVALHAGISINIPRYNLPLITVYAIGWGWVVTRRRRPANDPPPA